MFVKERMRRSAESGARVLRNELGVFEWEAKQKSSQRETKMKIVTAFPSLQGFSYVHASGLVPADYKRVRYL